MKCKSPLKIGAFFCTARKCYACGPISSPFLFRIIASLPRKFSDTDRACIAVAQERGMILATDDEDILAEARKRGIATFETEDILGRSGSKKFWRILSRAGRIKNSGS
jgi:hypothetical protein